MPFKAGLTSKLKAEHRFFFFFYYQVIYRYYLLNTISIYKSLGNKKTDSICKSLGNKTKKNGYD